MKKFKVLDRSLPLHQHYLLEASAGTGKTFSIQNIVVRLLIEPKGNEAPITIEKILAVTFTKAAARDLKNRIRANIEQALHYLQSKLFQDPIAEQAPDYLKAYMERGEESLQIACKQLQQALFAFDQAQIFTIHSFCARMLSRFALESNMGLHSSFQDDLLSQSEIMAIIRDFFRTEVRKERYSPAQLEILLKKDQKQQKLLKLLQKGQDFPLYPSFKEVYLHFHDTMAFLKKNLSLTSEKMIEDFRLQAKFYGKYCDESKVQTLDKVIRFANLFDQEKWSPDELDRLMIDGLVWVKALNPCLLKKKNPPSPLDLHFPDLTKQLEKTLYPLIEEASDVSILLARMAQDCQHLFRRYQQEEEKLSHDDLLRKMNMALDHHLFLVQIQANYQAAIIDEFQDTDPLQWQIFRRLFIPDHHHWNGYLYLVGDPKQSIYSFRQADIYTYLSAAQELGDSHCYSLDVNYRSQPRLVQALNALFSSDDLPHLIPLPKKNTHLPYQPVESAEGNSEQCFEDEHGAIHFFIADGQAFKKPKLADLETHIFFPFIVQEIIRLKKEKKFALRQFAVLVRDREQALRLAEFFDRHGIPSLNQKKTTLANSSALQSFIHLLRAVLDPHDRGVVLAVLASPFFGWTEEELKAHDPKFIFKLMLRLRICLFEKGFAIFFQEFLQAVAKPNGGCEKTVNDDSVGQSTEASFPIFSQPHTVQEQMLAREDGLEFYRDLQQIADMIVDHQYKEWNGPNEIVPFLDQFQIWEQNHDDRVKRFQDHTTDGVHIMTLHFSKGLEFEIVFALGLVNRRQVKEELIPIESKGQLLLTPVNEDSEEYRRYCEENDAEKMRQLYVALTRAKIQLYIPVALHLPSEKLEMGEASPMDLFLARLGQPIASHQALYERIQCYDGKSLFDFLEGKGKQHFITYSQHQKIDFISSQPQKDAIKESTFLLVEPPTVSVPNRSLWITSFSSLSKHAGGTATDFVTSFTHDKSNSSKDIHTLPANSEIGVLIHHVLEKLNFNDFKKLKNGEDAIPFVHPFVQKSVFKEWESVIASLIFNTLQTPFPQIPGSFCLAHLEPVQLYREMPFIFPYKKGRSIEDIHFHEGLIKGVIDLFFRHEGFYYLVDWKTNWLGPRTEDYSLSAMKIAMGENAYFLQAAIYTEAIKRYLKLVESRSFEKCFGGVFYLFLRGMQPGSNTGIYHEPFPKEFYV
jgi:exodeoxyribonuclease V beta subunit